MALILYAIECKSDKILINSLGISNKLIKHSGNKSRVLRFLENNSNSIGLVDEDPHSLDNYKLDNYLLLKSFDTNINLYQNKSSNNVLIVLRPRLEEWIISASLDAKINLNNYGLPNDGKDLKKVINHKLISYSKLLTDLKDFQYLNDLKNILDSKFSQQI